MSERIAIVGYSAQTGKANDAEELWNLIVNDKSSIERLGCVGTGRRPYGSYIKEAKKFDYEFFGYSYAEAKQIDPQHRLLLKHAWIALEMSGEANVKENNKIGVFACCGINTYLLENILPNSSFEKLDENPFSLIGNANDFLATRIAYKLNCKGPAVTMQCGCSSSLVAIHMARLSLINNDSDLVIVGGVNLTDYEQNGYCFIEGGVTSNTGKCRAFEKNADGTVFSSGVGVLILKRFDDALKDRNTIYGIIEVTAVNNDGADKGGFTAPSLSGQVSLLKGLLGKNSVNINDIAYLETHGTATSLGDSIEYMALEKIYKEFTNKRHFCKLGALKNNIGHTDVSAGILGIIKILKAFEHNIRPGMLNFQKPSDTIKLEDSPFVLTKDHDKWPEGKRTAAITALGIGGTNAHVVLSHYSRNDASSLVNNESFFLMSAKNNEALEKYIEKLSTYLTVESNRSLNTCFSLNCGRKNFSYRASLRLGINGNIVKRNTCDKTSDIIFGFPGQGAQYCGMALELYNSYAFFRKTFDKVIALFEQNGIKRLKERMFSNTDLSLRETLYTQPALFIVEYSLAVFLMNLGIKPIALLGHSLGEYACYVIARMISLEDAVYLLSQRAKLLNNLKNGGMISVNAEYEEIKGLIIKHNCDVAAKNARDLFSISGLKDEIAELKEELIKANIGCRDIRTSAAFHSRYLEGVLKKFENVCENITFNKGNIPLISNIDGKLVYKINAEYLVQHMKSSVDFISVADTIGQKFNNSIVIEIGPGRTISSLLQMNEAIPSTRLFVSMRSNVENTKSDSLILSELLENLWLNGVLIDFEKFYDRESLSKVSLPTYAFSECECYIKPESRRINKINKVSEWFYKECLVRFLGGAKVIDRIKTINIKDVCRYKPENEDHLVIELVDHVSINDFVNMIELVQNYNERMPSVKRIDIVSYCPNNVYSVVYKSFARCLNQEMSFLSIRFIEVNHNTDRKLSKEVILSDIRSDHIRIMDNRVYRVDFIPITKMKDHNVQRYKNVLIIGGMGKMSSYYANALAEFVNGKIILASRTLRKLEEVTRSNLPKNFQDISNKLATCDVDVSVVQSLDNCLKWIVNKFGKVDLVVHAAGVPQSEHTRRIADIDIAYVNKVMGPKLAGLNNICALQPKYTYKVMVVSSISSVLGGIDLLVYAASHNVVDFFAAERNWNVHSWDALQIKSDRKEGLGVSLNSIAIDDVSAVEALKQAMWLDNSVIISTVDLRERVGNWTASDTGCDVNKEYSPRPTVRSIYIPPETEMEKRMHDIWRDFLGFDQIGINDNFFELGGDSLQALQLVKKIAEKLHWGIKTVDLFEFPTIHSIVTKYDNSVVKVDDSHIKQRAAKKQQYLSMLQAKKRRKK